MKSVKKDKMKCILIGYGYWGKILENYLKQSDQFELAGIYRSHNQNLPDSTALLAEGIGCAFVCVPLCSHFNVVSSMLDSGVHVFCEKPLCHSLSETQYLFQKARYADRILFTDYIYTVSPSLQYIKNNLGILGGIKYIRMSIRQFGKFYRNENVYEVLGVHMISVLIYLFDTRRDEIHIPHVESVPGACNEAEAGIIFFKIKDIKGIIDCSLLSDKKERKIEFICDNGVMIFDMMEKYSVRIIQHIKPSQDEFQKEQKELYRRQFDEKNNLKNILESFCHAVLHRETENERISLQTAYVLEQISRYLK